MTKKKCDEKCPKGKDCNCEQKTVALEADYTPISVSARQAQDTSAERIADEMGLGILAVGSTSRKSHLVLSEALGKLKFAIEAKTNCGTFIGGLMDAVPAERAADTSFINVAVRYSLIHDTEDSHSAKVMYAVVEGDTLYSIINAISREITGEIQYSYTQMVEEANKK